MAVADPTTRVETPIGACFERPHFFQEDSGVVVGNYEHGGLINDCTTICLQIQDYAG